MRHNRPVLFVYFLLGAYAVCAQATLLRDTQVVLFGSELSWGLVLACWLAGVAVGAQLAGVLASSAVRATRVFVASNLAIPVVLAAEITLLRAIRSMLGAGPGEYIGLGNMVLVAVVATVPVSVWIGLAFPAASVMLGQRSDEPGAQARSIGAVYVAESLGSLVGGVLFSFLFVETLDALTLVVGGGAVLAAATSYMAYCGGRSRTSSIVATCLTLVAAGALAGGVVGRLNDATLRWRWASFARGLELVAAEDSKYQNISVGRLADQFSLYTNGTLASTWPDAAAFAIEAHLAACEHPAPRRMLVLGGGAEGLVRELLRHRPERLDYVTFDGKVLEVIMPHLTVPDSAALHSPQTQVHYTDARRFVKRAAQSDSLRYDLVVMAVSEPASALEARLYTEEFFEELSAAMADDGVLAFSMRASAGSWSAELASYVGSVVVPMERVFPEVLLTFGDPMRVFAAARVGVLTSSGRVLAERYRSRYVASPNFDPIWFEGASDLLDPDKRALVERALSTHPPRHYNTDDRPIASLYHMRMWLARSSEVRGGESAQRGDEVRVLNVLLGLDLRWVVTVVLGGTLITALAGLRGGRVGLGRAALIWSVGTTGFASMAVEIVLLYTLQVLYGYVYAMLGLVVGTFMFGLVTGSSLMNRHLDRVMAASSRLRRSSLGAVLTLDVMVAFFGVVLLAVLGLIRASASDVVVQVAVFSLVATAGVLGGAVFPLGAAVWLHGRSGAGRAAAAVATSDYVGACVGALATGVVLVPILGISRTCIVVIAVKTLSAVLVSVADAAAGRAKRLTASSA